jgi:serine/threonine-protein phosphatase 2A regulatory subunit B
VSRCKEGDGGGCAWGCARACVCVCVCVCARACGAVVVYLLSVCVGWVGVCLCVCVVVGVYVGVRAFVCRYEGDDDDVRTDK